MAIESIQLTNKEEELLFPKIGFEQIFCYQGADFENFWSQLKNEIFQAVYPIGSVLILESSIISSLFITVFNSKS